MKAITWLAAARVHGERRLARGILNIPTRRTLLRDGERTGEAGNGDEAQEGREFCHC